MCSVTFGAQLLQSEQPVRIQHRQAPPSPTRICSKHSLTQAPQDRHVGAGDQSDNNEQCTVDRGAGSAQLLAPAAQIEGRTEQSGLCQNEERAEDAVAAVYLVAGRTKMQLTKSNLA
eukprot:TRINITY_DN5414_c0_g1_i9.p1 TRINITY_DN5414_c0_g1~~TRINITY_DN5414_c0_g1_i9.p1  ORF type:complete len:117 (+),score=26.20 TRINITY_DN5414_c0_g1_i9:305-655(+)